MLASLSRKDARALRAEVSVLLSHTKRKGERSRGPRVLCATRPTHGAPPRTRCVNECLLLTPPGHVCTVQPIAPTTSAEHQCQTSPAPKPDMPTKQSQHEHLSSALLSRPSRPEIQTRDLFLLPRSCPATAARCHCECAASIDTERSTDRSRPAQHPTSSLRLLLLLLHLCDAPAAALGRRARVAEAEARGRRGRGQRRRGRRGRKRFGGGAVGGGRGRARRRWAGCRRRGRGL